MKILIVVTILVFLVGFGITLSPTAQIELQLLTKNTSNPEEDARRDLKNGKPRCYQLNGFVPYFPGAKTEIESKICNSLETKNIRGTSDAIQSKRHSSAIKKAARYAYEYNKFIINHERKKI